MNEIGIKSATNPKLNNRIVPCPLIDVRAFSSSYVESLST